MSNYSAHDAEFKPMKISVTAPATLQAGYTFEALINDDPARPFSCEVPDGGVVEGQRFYATVPESRQEHLQAPCGGWKDGLFACFAEGVCHPHLWCAFFCSKLLMAQIMTRMSLTWLGEPGSRASTQNTFKVVVLLLVSYIIYAVSLEAAALDYPDQNLPTLIVVLKAVGSVLFALWSVYAVCRTRQSIRAQYSIPETHCAGCEDLVCSIACTCCSLAQMARHTGEYETYKGSCCTTSGLSKGAPLTV